MKEIKLQTTLTDPETELEYVAVLEISGHQIWITVEKDGDPISIVGLDVWSGHGQVVMTTQDQLKESDDPDELVLMFKEDIADREQRTVTKP